MKTTLEIAGTELEFDITREAYTKYLNDLQPNNKVQPSHNFCVRCVEKDTREALYIS